MIGLKITFLNNSFEGRDLDFDQKQDTGPSDSDLV